MRAAAGSAMLLFAGATIVAAVAAVDAVAFSPAAAYGRPAAGGGAPQAAAARSAPEAAAQASPGAAAQGLTRTSCTACHLDEELWEPEEIAVVAGFRDDVHAAVGLSCHDCHGGNPDPALAEDYLAAMDDGFAPNPYRGPPERAGVPAFCGTCHSDATYMRRFAPSLRIDQEAEYRTSRHGQLLAEGDTNVATCIDCHGTHGIRRPANPASGVYPTRVAETCSGCHADVERMAGYTLVNGAPLPIDQYARWRESVHAAAMFEREDLSAPTCNDCHGNHGASPPGLDSVAFVCGQCHGREAEIFRASPKRAGFEDHNQYLLDAEGEGCIACHDPPEPAASLSGFNSFGECAACHGNHGVVRPTLSFLSPLPDTPCAFCHAAGDGDDARFRAPEEDMLLFLEVRDGLRAEAAELGLEGTERFDWLVDRAETLPYHTVPAAPDAEPRRRPEFDTLYTKFRIGKTSYTFEDPVSGQVTRSPILRCASCHADPGTLGDDAVGIRVAGELLNGMRDLTARVASAERTLLAARRGGVEIGGTGLEVERAVDAQISLEVLLHGFNAAPDSEFAAVHAEGMAHAEAAIAAGQAARAELSYRRQGLVIASILIVMVLIGLALKIREVSGREAGP